MEGNHKEVYEIRKRSKTAIHKKKRLGTYDKNIF